MSRYAFDEIAPRHLVDEVKNFVQADRAPSDTGDSPKKEIRYRFQVPVSKRETAIIVKVASDYGIRGVEILKSAWRIYWWACQQIDKGHDVGALDRESGRFIAIDVPYAIEIGNVSHRSEERGSPQSGRVA